MKLLTREQSGILIASASGRIDHIASEAFGNALEALIADCQPGKPPLLLDFSGVEYISSAGLRVLMIASRHAKAQQGVFAITSLQPLVQEVFAISRFNLIIPCYLNIEAACKVLGK
ncbi:STAS domain-containing protein [Quatrionicoccus australiensis]|uniref:STAS domain-containing protein n=1 Tax=Quatrionicoccus australiensis TaxID=138118 RepID=UPI001CF9ADF6|nr:STAS domain-containing protein [Quatrionicoccus australiensis]MCB4361704.1 STAS domain-containing protein [Quatrionicoccus australiensis]